MSADPAYVASVHDRIDQYCALFSEQMSREDRFVRGGVAACLAAAHVSEFEQRGNALDAFISLLTAILASAEPKRQKKGKLQ